MFEKFNEWNQPQHINNTLYDERIVHALLLALVEEERLRNNDVPESVMDFVQGIFK